MQPFAVQVFGSPRVLAFGEKVDLSDKALALVGYLAEAKSRMLTKETDRRQLSGLLWPSSMESSARHSLSQCLYSIKKACGNQAPLIDGDHRRVWLGPCSTDIQVFEEALRQGDLVKAAGAYRGTFLLGVDIRRGNEFNDWRDRVRLHYEQLAHQLLDSLQIEGCWEDALILSQRLLQIDSARKSTHEALIRSLLRLGRAQEAEERHLDALAHGVDVPRGILEIHRTRQIWSAGHHTEAVPFVGRGEELGVLQAAFKEALVQGPRVVILEGEPGIGKTALIDRFLRWTVLMGAKAIPAFGYELERNVPFGIVAQWLCELPSPAVNKPWTSVIGRAFPEVSEEANHFTAAVRQPSEITLPRLLESLRRMLEHEANARPIVLGLDDAQFADAASVGFMHYLSRSHSDAPIVQVIGLRPALLESGLRHSFSDWNGVYRIRLRPFSRDNIVRLLAHWQYESHERLTADYILAKTNGNPFLVAALLRHGNNRADAALPETIVDFLEPQLARLSAHGNLVLNCLAVVGEAKRIEILEQLTGLRSPDVLAALRELEYYGLTSSDDVGVRLAHGLVGELGLAKLPDSVRRLLFGRAARLSATEGRSSPAVIAVQHDIAGNTENAFASALTAAAASEQLHAHREREFFLKLAYANAPSSTEAVIILLEIAKLLMQTGRASEAVNLLSSNAFSNAPEAVSATALIYRILSRLRLSSQVSNAIGEAPAEIERLRHLVDPLLIAKLYTALAGAAHDLGNTSVSLQYGQRAARLAAELPTGPETSRILIKAALVKAAHEGYEEGTVALASLENMVDDSAESRALFLIGKGLIAIRRGDLPRAEDNYLKAIELCESSGIYDTLNVVHNNLSVCYLEQGRYDDALIYMNAANAPREAAPRGRDVVVDNLAQLHYEIGQYQESYDIADVGVAELDRKGRSFFHLHGIRGLSALELGRIAAALESRREIELAMSSSEYWSNDMSYVETFLSRMLLLQGRTDAAMERLQMAADVYRGKDVLCRARIESEMIRHLARGSNVQAADRARSLLDELSGSGAVPLVERLQGLLARAQDC